MPIGNAIVRKIKVDGDFKLKIASSGILVSFFELVGEKFAVKIQDLELKPRFSCSLNT